MLKAWKIEIITDTSGKVHIKQGSPINFPEKIDKSELSSSIYPMLIQNTSSTAISSINIHFISSTKLYGMSIYESTPPDSNKYIDYGNQPGHYSLYSEFFEYPLKVTDINVAPGGYFVILFSLGIPDEPYVPADSTFSLWADSPKPTQPTAGKTIRPTTGDRAVVELVENKNWYIMIGGSAILVLVLAVIVYYYMNKSSQKLSFRNRDY